MFVIRAVLRVHLFTTAAMNYIQRYSLVLSLGLSSVAVLRLTYRSPTTTLLWCCYSSRNGIFLRTDRIFVGVNTPIPVTSRTLKKVAFMASLTASIEYRLMSINSAYFSTRFVHTLFPDRTYLSFLSRYNGSLSFCIFFSVRRRIFAR